MSSSLTITKPPLVNSVEFLSSYKSIFKDSLLDSMKSSESSGLLSFKTVTAMSILHYLEVIY